MGMENELISLDGLIKRLTEIREILGHDCPVVVSTNFDTRKNANKVVMASLDTKFDDAKGEKRQNVSIYIEPMKDSENPFMNPGDSFLKKWYGEETYKNMIKGKAIDKLIDQQHNSDFEEAHINADTILTDLLIKLGYQDVVDEWRKVERHYS